MLPALNARLMRICCMTTRRRSLAVLAVVASVVLLYILTTYRGEIWHPKANCTGYFELKRVKFLDDSMRNQLCKNITAYTLVDGRFPLCQLQRSLPVEIEHEIKGAASKDYLVNKVTGRNVTILGYSRADMISKEIARHHNWEGHLVTRLINIMKALPQGDVTFLDVGSNIGVYSLQAADAGFPTIAVDANIRNLVRMRLAAQLMQWPGDRLRLFWAFFSTRVSIRYLEFNDDSCNIGGAGTSSPGDSSSIVDTVPVMTAFASDLLPHLRTRLTVMKIDIETSEGVFFETAQRLLEERQIVVVQMEWWRASPKDPANISPNHRFLVDYFTSRNYVLLSPETLKRLDPDTFMEWDTLWVRQDVLDTVRGTLEADKMQL